MKIFFVTSSGWFSGEYNVVKNGNSIGEIGFNYFSRSGWIRNGRIIHIVKSKFSIGFRGFSSWEVNGILANSTFSGAEIKNSEYIYQVKTGRMGNEDCDLFCSGVKVGTFAHNNLSSGHELAVSESVDDLVAVFASWLYIKMNLKSGAD